MNRTHALTAALLTCLLPSAAVAAAAPADDTVDATERRAVLQALVTQLHANYVFPDVAKQVAAELQRNEARGRYAGATTTEAFAEALTKDLQATGKDGHFRVAYEPEFRGPPEGKPLLPSDEEVRMGRQQAGTRGYGISKIERLPGNVRLHGDPRVHADRTDRR